MKKLLLSALILAGFAVTAIGFSGNKIVEVSAAACDNPSCSDG